MTFDLDTPYDVSPTQVAAFNRDGFVRLKNVFSEAELAYYGAEITRLTLELNTETLPLDQRSTYRQAFLQVMNLWEQNALVGEFVFGQRLARIATRLLGVDGVRLYHDQSLYKEPGGGITPAHADQFYWPLASDRSVTAWIPLQAVSDEMGPLGFFAGSQQVKAGRDLHISDESEKRISANMGRRNLPFISEPFELGEISFHLGWTFHRAAGNFSASPRSVMTVIYMDQNMRLKEPTAMTRADRDTWCPGSQTGHIIDTPKNPVLYRRADD
jgi:ectoine hydroxylase-related dioxygenase (phytanoyl-CoA dioxygenase family)